MKRANFDTTYFKDIELLESKESIKQKVEAKNLIYKETPNTILAIDCGNSVGYFVFRDNKLIGFDSCTSDIISIGNVWFDYYKDDMKQFTTHVTKCAIRGIDIDIVDNKCKNCNVAESVEYCPSAGVIRSIIKDKELHMCISFDTLGNDMVLLEDLDSIPIDYERIEKENLEA